jgi:hypothetical protein
LLHERLKKVQGREYRFPRIYLDSGAENCDGWIVEAFDSRFALSPLISRSFPDLRGTEWGLFCVPGVAFMLRVTCDSCGRELPSGEDRYVVKIEVYAAHDPAELTEEDLDADHLDEMGNLLRDLEEVGETPCVEPSTQQIRYDMCPDCRARYVRDPLGKDAAQKFHFSKN